MIHTSKERISIQVTLSGYSFKIYTQEGIRSSGWLGAERVFTTPELMKRYESVELSLLTPKCALVPDQFFKADKAAAQLADTVRIRPQDKVDFVPVPEYGAVLLFSNTIDESLSKVIAQNVLNEAGESPRVLPELYYILTFLQQCGDYNRILASYRDGYLHLAISQGRSLLLANVYEAVDFTTAEYHIFSALKALQMNPEVSTICFRTPLDPDQEMSLYRYFKSVEQI